MSSLHHLKCTEVCVTDLTQTSCTYVWRCVLSWQHWWFPSCSMSPTWETGSICTLTSSSFLPSPSSVSHMTSQWQVEVTWLSPDIHISHDALLSLSLSLQWGTQDPIPGWSPDDHLVLWLGSMSCCLCVSRLRSSWPSSWVLFSTSPNNPGEWSLITPRHLSWYNNTVSLLVSDLWSHCVTFHYHWSHHVNSWYTNIVSLLMIHLITDHTMSTLMIH